MEGTSLSPLWEFLRRNRLQHLAVELVRHGVHTVEGIAHQSAQLVADGMQECDVSQLLACIQPERQQEQRGRSDLPPLYQNGQRASFTLALVAAQPNDRKRALDDLDRDVLARSTEPAQQSRVRTYRALCAAWGVAPFPLSVENIRCSAASFKAGGYRSAALYLQAAVNYQIRFMKEPIHPLLRATIKDVVRSIKRGLGPARLKEGFDVFSLSSVVDTDDMAPFDFRRPSHLVDVCIIGCWFMLREIELAGAYRQHLTIEADQVHLLIPVHKTASAGALTNRSLRCPCKTLVHRLRPWHAAERHLIRLNMMDSKKSSIASPLMPDPAGNVVTKAAFIDALRMMLLKAGISVYVVGESGQQLPRFGGHSMRVSGAMMLANAQVPLYLIQMLGRWSSSSVERYVQNAPLNSVPSLPSGVFGQQDFNLPVSLVGSQPGPHNVPNPSTPAMAPSVVVQPAATSDDRVPALTAVVDSIKQELQIMRGLISTPESIFIARPRSKVVHLARVDEHSNIPQVWQTKCGWSYGCSCFFRVPSIEDRHSKCKKCFPSGDGHLDPADSEESQDEADSSGDSSSSESSS